MAIFGKALWFYLYLRSEFSLLFSGRESSDLLGEFFGGFVECQLQGTCFILMILWSAFVAVSFEGIWLIREFCRK